MLATASRASPAFHATPPIPGTHRHAGNVAGSSAARASADPKQQLTEDQLKQLSSLQARDREVRNHEAAHQAAAGGLATSGASFSYQRGPDGQFYAIGGEVHIDTSPVAGNPAATLAKAQTVIQAALAPADPSGQDRQVAAQAAQVAARARAELSTQGKAHGADHPHRSDPTEPFKAVANSDQTQSATTVDEYA